jgi:hypothetical protein
MVSQLLNWRNTEWRQQLRVCLQLPRPALTLWVYACPLLRFFLRRVATYVCCSCYKRCCSAVNSFPDSFWISRAVYTTAIVVVYYLRSCRELFLPSTTRRGTNSDGRIRPAEEETNRSSDGLWTKKEEEGGRCMLIASHPFWWRLSMTIL